MKGTCKSLIQDLRFNGQCVCVCVGGGGGGGSYQPGVYVPLKALFLVLFHFCRIYAIIVIKNDQFSTLPSGPSEC